MAIVDQSGRRAACTVVARNYLAMAAVLESSFRATNPGIEFLTLVIDGSTEDRDAHHGRTILLPEDLGLPAEVLEPMIVMYSVMELATALKPALLSALLRRGYESVAYLDPDIQVFGGISDVFALGSEHGIVLTPHALEPMSRDGLEITETTIMHSGIFNLGFVAVGHGAAPFLEWWHERLRTDAVVDFGNALFTDQRWVDWVPALFSHVVCRDPGLNVAYWNVHERPLTRTADGTVYAGDSPLRFFHFSGFDMASPWALSRFMGEQPRVLVSQEPVLRELCVEYGVALEAAGHREVRATPYANDVLPGGPLLTGEVRRLYRDSFLGHLPLLPPPSTPLQDPVSLRTWLRTPVQCAPWSRLAPADLVLWRSRPDLQARFPSVLGAASAYYREWLDEDASVPEHYALLDIGEPESTSSGQHRGPRHRTGWSVVACGEPSPSGEVLTAARRVAWEAARAGLSFELVEGPGTGSLSGRLWQHQGVGAGHDHDNVVVVVDAENFSEDRIVQAVARRRGRLVALWLSDTPEIAASQRHVLAHFHEVWVLTDALVTAARESTSVPIRRVTLRPGDHDGGRTVEQEQLVIARGGGPVLLQVVDARADFEQQNVTAAITAFSHAFRVEDDARLVVHVRHGDLTRRQEESLRYAIAGRKDVLLERAACDESTMCSLVRDVDAVVSLHRSCSWGLALVDAMAAGTTVLATGWCSTSAEGSGPGAFVPVGHSLVARPHRVVGASGSNVWAEPDLKEAVAVLRSRSWVRADADRDQWRAADGSSGRGAVHISDMLRATALGEESPAVRLTANPGGRSTHGLAASGDHVG